MNGLSRRLITFLGSRRFWYVVLGFFIFEALWFVFTAVYPMAFDEDFHLGVIRIYAEHWSPFLAAHPEGADQFGAVARDPSYLYHYLMSFPYRLLTHLTTSEPTQVIILRLLNVGLCAFGLVLFRKLMLRARASRALVNVALAIFVLIPIVPQLAAHINYDNLLMVLLPLLCLAVLNLSDGFRERRIDVVAALGFLAIGLYMCVVKYAALPFLMAAVLFLVCCFAFYFWGNLRSVGTAIRRGAADVRRSVLLALVAVCAIGLVLFVQRYGINIAQYQTPVPDCGKVLTVAQCSSYGPWGRDYYFEQTKPSEFNPSPLVYMKEWLVGMWFRTFFAVNGPASEFTNYPPLTVPGRAAIAVLIFGLLAVTVWWRRVFHTTAVIFFGVLILMYCAVLWFDQYGMYRQTAQPVAINGRYLLPVLPLLAVILGRAFSVAASSIKRVNLRAPLKAGAAMLVLLLFLHGGGVFTYILRSDSSWYWPNAAARNLNETSQKILAPITLEGSKFY